MLITGIGSVFYIKWQNEEKYRNANLFLTRIDSISVNGKEVGFIQLEIDDLVDYLGFNHGETLLTWISNDENELFELGIEYDIQDAKNYRLILQHVKCDNTLGDIYLTDIINVNGEDILTKDSIKYRIISQGVFTPEMII